MSRPVLVDSSWYIARARQGRDPLIELALSAEDRDIAACALHIGAGVLAVDGRFRKIPGLSVAAEIL